MLDRLKWMATLVIVSDAEDGIYATSGTNPKRSNRYKDGEVSRLP